MRAQVDRYKAYRAPIPSWRIFRQWGGTKTFLGVVEAPDKAGAIRLAIGTFQITNPDHQKHLIAEVRD